MRKSFAVCYVVNAMFARWAASHAAKRGDVVSSKTG